MDKGMPVSVTGGDRVRDVISLPPRATTQDVIRLNNMFRGATPHDVLRGVLIDRLAGEVALVSSFGAESAILLDLVARIDRGAPVLFLDTGKHFPETLDYRDMLIAHLGLTNVTSLVPDATELAVRDGTGLRWSYDPDGCCDLRKVRPLERALAGYDATISGRKAFQSATRANLPHFELDSDAATGMSRLKVNPLASWTKADLDAYVIERALPPHPLVAQGYPSIGCAPCTSKVKPGEDPRAGRWRGWEKTECGLHGEVTPLPPRADGSEDPVF
ncbi:MAG: phosphoadenylyl-sulfate reductase [Sphingopyxis sp.]